MFKLYEDYLEGFLISLIPGSRESRENQRSWQLSSIHIHCTLMIITILMASLSLPTLISWYKAVT